MREPWNITRDMFLSLAEVDELLAHVRHTTDRGSSSAESPAAAVDRVIIEALLFSGLRNTEYCRLTLGDVDLGREPAFLVRGTPREDRRVFISQELAGLLKTYVAEIRPALLPSGVSSRDREQAFVLNERGRGYERTALYRRVVRILTEAGLGERASVQLLRHTYGYLAYLRTGGNLLFCQRQLGHAHPMVTSVYAEFVEQSYADLADAVARREPRAAVPRRRARMSR